MGGIALEVPMLFREPLKDGHGKGAEPLPSDKQKAKS